ncbi:35517_t:CDS:1 [Gigaspora margarita]|uniref:35517_t:CDS:1 n=1 Tax=Gigaspora margarita TaxID=4874 RepID=A0ABN7UI22_GIGMA|nr:35517_t:CDS:1 [Gigaspora margarita]
MEDRKKWNATGPKAAKQLAFFKPYFPELSTLSLENHSLCQTHYNQVVMSNRFYEHLTSYFQENPPDTDMDTQTPSYTDLIAELDVTKTILENVKQENMELCKKTKRTWQYLEEQARETEELTKRLQQAYEEVNTYQRLYEDQFERNRALIEQWDSRFFSRQKRIDAVVDIAKAERESLFDDISKLFEFWELGKKSID